MARDRQRAKARKQRREPTPPKRDEADGGRVPQSRPLHRENVPGPVEHTGDVDEFEAALVAGADGEPESDPDAVDRVSAAVEQPLDGDGLDGDGIEDERHTAVDGADAGAVSVGRRGVAQPHEPAHGQGGGRFLNFLRACWAELQRVQWPDRQQVGQATMVVIGFVLIAGAFLGFADYVAQKLVDLIL